LAAALVGAALVLAAPAMAADAVRVLLIDGQNNHDWKATTPVLKAMLEKTGRFTVEVLTSPPKLDPKADEAATKAHEEAWAKFRPEFAKYQVVFSNYNDIGKGDPWPDEVRKAFEKYVQDGGGLVVYHSANNAFPQWDEWNKMIGLGWRSNQFGDRLWIDEGGKVVRTPKGEGPGAGHGPSHVFEVTIRDKDHPIMKGMPETWTQVPDQLSHGQRGPAQNMNILASAFSAKEKGGTGTNEPMVWTVTYGKGRVFVNLLGHDVPSTTAPGCVALMVRGTEWAATGAVTIPPPAEIPAPPPAAPAPKAEEKKGEARK
jgi:type 1 glutamine amidotransferase